MVLAKFYSMADSSTTVAGIPIRIAGDRWARRQLYAGIKYVPVTSKLSIFRCLLWREDICSTQAEFYSIGDSSPTFRDIPIQIAGGCCTLCQLYNGMKYVPIA